MLPRGRRDLVQQLAVWIVLGLAYEAVRGTAGHDRAQAFRDGRAVIRIEQRLHLLFEPSLVRLVERAPPAAAAIRWSYWLSEFTVLVLALLWTYLRHRDRYPRFRDAVIAANALGLLGYLLVPTAPPRLFHAYGFVNRLSGQPRPGQAAGLLGFAANPYAAMPSIHAADALLTGIVLAQLAERRPIKLLWLLWPSWVFFAVLASANHFWLDLAAGAAAAGIGLLAARPLARAASALRNQRS